MTDVTPITTMAARAMKAFDLDRLAIMTIDELSFLYGAVHCLGEQICNAANHPRAWREDRKVREYSAGGKVLFELLDAVDFFRDEVVDALEKQVPVTLDEAEARADVLMRAALAYCEDWPGLASKAASFSQEVVQFERQRLRGGF